MKKLDLSLISSMDFVQEEQYLLTQNELELLNKGELTFYNGTLYRTKDIPREIPTIDLTPEDSLPLLNLYGDKKDVPDPFANKHLSSRPSLLEAWTAGDAQLIDNIRKETKKHIVTEQPYLTLGVHEIPPHKNSFGLFETVNPEASDKLKTILNKMKPVDQNDDCKLIGLGLWNVAGTLVAQYIDQVDAEMYEGNWSVGLAKQDQYWDLFRGQTINIIRLGLQLKVGDMSKYALPTPIEGMK